MYFPPTCINLQTFISVQYQLRTIELRSFIKLSLVTYTCLISVTIEFKVFYQAVPSYICSVSVTIELRSFIKPSQVQVILSKYHQTQSYNSQLASLKNFLGGMTYVYYLSISVLSCRSNSQKCQNGTHLCCYASTLFPRLSNASEERMMELME